VTNARAINLLEQLTKPRCLGHVIGHSAILGALERETTGYRFKDQEMRLALKNTT
jgi:hypothetical protein